MGNSAELVAALRENLMVEVATPLAVDLAVHLSGRFGQSSDGGYEFGSGILIEVEPNRRVSGSVASFAMQTFSDWDHDEAWQYFREETETGLVNSLAATGGFKRDDSGRVPLKVAAVRTGYRDGEAQDAVGDGMVLELWPERGYHTGSRRGTTPPEGYTEDVQVVLIELTPALVAIGGAAASEPSEETESPEETTVAGTVTVSPDVLERLAGEYGENGQSMVIWIDGENLLLSNPDDPESKEWTLHPLSEKEFWTEYDGTRIELSFSRDDEGKAFAVTIKQMGFEMTLPRQR